MISVKTSRIYPGDNMIKSIKPSLTGLPQLTIPLCRVISLEGDRQEQVNGY
jgi:hypothetical protein